MILDVHGQEIDDVWAGEFRGFFAADGYLGIVANGYSKRLGYHTYTARAQITQRADNGAVLEAIQERLGGNLWGGTSSLSGRPTLNWRTRSTGEVRRVCALLDDGRLPLAKSEEVEIVQAFLALEMKFGPKTTDAERAARDHVVQMRGHLARELRRAREWRG